MEANKALVERYVDCFNAGDLEGLRAVFADDALVHGVLGWGKIDDVMPIWRQLVAALGMRLRIEDMAADGNVVAVRYTETGTSRAPFFEHPATGRSYELLALEWFEIENGRIKRRWGARDAAQQARQLGWQTAADKAEVERAKRPPAA